MRFIKNIAMVSLTLISLAAQAQSYTGVGGTGWREVSIPVAPSDRKTAQSAKPSTAPRPSVLLQIDDANGLAASPLPQVVKDNIARDGFSDGSIFVDRDVANAIADGTAATKYAQYTGSDSGSEYDSVDGVEQPGRATIQRVTAQGLFCKSGWRTYTLTKTFAIKTGALSVPATGGSVSFDGQAAGSATVNIVAEYKRSDWSLCIPYAVRFQQARASGAIDMNNSRLALTASASATVAEYASPPAILATDGGYFMIGPVPVWWNYSVPLNVGFKVIVGAASTADYSSQITGKITFDYTCHDGACTGTNDMSTVNLSNTTPNLGVQADATFDPFVKVGVIGNIYPIGPVSLAAAGVFLKLSAPFEVYGYYGNTCGDSDANGANELANTYFVDWQARLSLETSWAIIGSERRQYISIPGTAGRKINGALSRVLDVENHHTPLWSRRLYFKDYTPTNASSIFSPILRRQSSSLLNGRYAYVVRTSLRPCATLDTNYVVNILDPSGTPTAVTVNGKTGYTDTTFYATTPSLVLRPVGVADDDGRSLSNSGDTAPLMVYNGTGSGGSGQGTFQYVSMTRTAPGASGDTASITIKNVGTNTITSISRTCSGQSWHVWANPVTTLAAGQSAVFQCQTAASGSYPAPVFTITGTGASNSPFSPAL